MIIEKEIDKSLKGYALKLIEFNYNNRVYQIEINILKKKDKYELHSFWQPAYLGFSWYDFHINNNYISGKLSEKMPPEFIDYCNILVSKFFKLKAFL